MNYKDFILNYFDEQLLSTTWLINKDSVYADCYSALQTKIEQSAILSEGNAIEIAEQIDDLIEFYILRSKIPADWVTPKKKDANELVHKEDGSLTQESAELLYAAISDKNSEKTLISDTGKTVSFGEKWHSMLRDCGFKSMAVNRLIDFICKFIEADGWSKYFVGNIGKNNKRLIQEYHPMDKYNLYHNTNYAAMHLGGDTTKCVLVSVDTISSDGRGEPSGITFLEIGAHTIIDRFIVGSFKSVSGKPITEATAEELAELLDIN